MSLTERLVVTKESASLNIMKTDFTANVTPVIQDYHAVSHENYAQKSFPRGLSKNVYVIKMACELSHNFQTLTIRH